MSGDSHLPRHDRASGLFATLGEAAGDEQLVEAKFQIADFGLRITGRPPNNNPQFRMSDKNLRDSLKTMMVESLMLKVTKDEIRDDMPLFGPEGLGLDSIDALELVVGLEKQFGVKVPNSEAAKQALASVNSLHDYVLANRPV
jgi:acyl carrier protein